MPKPFVLLVLLVLNLVVARYPVSSPPRAADVLHADSAAAPLSDCVVSSTEDSGSHTLRYCLQNYAWHGQTIRFDPAVFPPDNPATIHVTSAQLPSLIEDEVTIDGSDAGVIIDGSGAPGGTWPEGTRGLLIASSHNIIRGLQIVNFPSNGILIGDGAQYNTIGGSRLIGAGPLGQGNLISGNGFNGIDINGDHNNIVGNFIGTTIDGAAAYGNSDDGILIKSSSNVIGSTEDGYENVISGSVRNSGIRMEGQSAFQNKVIGNLIGLDATASFAIGNGADGVRIHGGARDNQIGGAGPGEPNIIGGNQQDGVVIFGTGTHSNQIIGNFIGTDGSGTHPLGNGGGGVDIFDGASDNVIGGVTPAERNVISANGWACPWCPGVRIDGVYSQNNIVFGNYIGVDATGVAALGNQNNGVWIGNEAQGNSIGGAEAGKRNVISGNARNGIEVSYAYANSIEGNYIGTDATGMAQLGNGERGIGINGGEQSAVCRSNDVLYNVISGNGTNGIDLYGGGTYENSVLGNYIGLNAAGTQAIPNGEQGIWMGGSANHNQIGGDSASERNVFAGNGANGIHITDYAYHNTIKGNYIGVDATGTTPMPNGQYGMMVAGSAHNNTIGPSNLIEHHYAGLIMLGAETTGNTITRNSIYSNEGAGIELVVGANTELAAPVVLEVSAATCQVTGTACSHCTVEVFSDDDDEGRWFEGTVSADHSGAWSFVKGTSCSGAVVRATATDGSGNTSAFSLQPVAPTPILEVTPDALELRWTQTEYLIIRYDVHRSTMPYFVPGAETLLGSVDAPGVGNEAVYVDDTAFAPPLTNYFYVVEAVKEGEIASPVTGRDGTFSVTIEPGALQ